MGRSPVCFTVDFHGAASGVGGNRVVFQEIFAWFHRASFDWVVYGHQFCAVGEGRFDLDFVDHLGYSIHNIGF